MFISEQYGWLANISGDYWDAMLDYGAGMYWLVGHLDGDAYRDVDMAMMGL